jgi:hypothetical protein
MVWLKNKIVGWVLAALGRPIIPLIAAGLFFLVIFLSRWLPPPDSERYQQDYRAWKARAEVAEQNFDIVRDENLRIWKYVDSTKKEIAQKDKELAALRTKVTIVRKNNDKVLAELKKELPDTCKSAIKLAESYRAESDLNKKGWDVAETQKVSLHHINDSLMVANTRLTAQNKSLITLVHDVPEYHAPKFLKIFPLPSRTASFAMGTVVGVVGVVSAYAVVHK